MKKKKKARKKIERKIRREIEELRSRKVEELVTTVAVAEPPKPWVNHNIVAMSAIKKAGTVIHPFDHTQWARQVAPHVVGNHPTMAMDETVIEVSAWSAAQVFNNAFFNGQTFLGYPYLSELMQRAEYRRPVEVLSTEVTRRWIKLKSKSNDRGKSSKIAELQQELERLGVQHHFRRASEIDSAFGRAHLYMEMVDEQGNPIDVDDLKTSIGNGRNDITQAKLGDRTSFLKGIKIIEPVWTYPGYYNSNDPLNSDWYDPKTWIVWGREIHVTRMLRFCFREVPDLLKPMYQFGGLSLTQMIKPAVDNWLRTRQSVADMIWSFSVMVLATDTVKITQPGSELLNERLRIFSNYRTNQGIMVLNKEEEELTNVSAPLGTLDALQAQSQEQMCSVSNTPVVKLLGIQPAGLNASSQGELTVWNEWCSAYQEKFYDLNLTTVIAFAQRNIWGEVDEDIVHEWEQIAEPTDAEVATTNKTKADTDAVYTSAAVLHPEEVRKRISNDPSSGYSDIDPDDAPEPPQELAPGEEGAQPAMLAPEKDDAELSQIFPRVSVHVRRTQAREPDAGARRPETDRAGDGGEEGGRRDGGQDRRDDQDQSRRAIDKRREERDRETWQR